MFITKDIITEAIKKSQEEELPCLFCKEATRQRGVFIDKDKVFGVAKPGMTRTVIYAVCKKHGSQSPVRNLMARYN
jgi:hypothetical protein